jgi:Uma2 family endonuclease
MTDPVRKTDRHYTYADYKTWPDDERWELIDGVAWNMSPAPGRTHQALAARLYTAFGAACEGTPCSYYPAPFDVFLPEDPETELDDVDTVVQPDLTLVCGDDAPLAGDGKADRPPGTSRWMSERGCHNAPDLVIEIVSPFTLVKDVEAKRRVYERAGVVEYWLIDPGNHGVIVHRLHDEQRYPEDPRILQWDGLLETPLLPNLKIDLRVLFEGLPI